MLDRVTIGRVFLLTGLKKLCQIYIIFSAKKHQICKIFYFVTGVRPWGIRILKITEFNTSVSCGVCDQHVCLNQKGEETCQKE